MMESIEIKCTVAILVWVLWCMTWLAGHVCCVTAREVRQFAGRNYIMEEAITGDFALVKAWKV